jgi:hypothetical protein
MKYTPIPDREAADLLGVSHSTIRYAVKRGVLTRAPAIGVIQHVVKEQLELFQGKTQVVMSALNKEERQRWELIDTYVTGESAQPVSPNIPPPMGGQVPVAQFGPSPYTPAPSAYVNFDPQLAEYLRVNNSALHIDGPQGAVNFPSALSDENADGTNTPAIWSSSDMVWVGVGILVGLLVLFFVANHKEKAKQQAEKTIASIGLEKEQLAYNQRSALATLSEHPIEMQQLRTILQREKLLSLVA